MHKVTGIPDVQSLLGPELVKLLGFREEENTIIVKPKQFLGREVFRDLAAKIAGMGGTYISAGKESRFEIPLMAPKVPPTVEKPAVRFEPTIKIEERFDNVPIQSVVSMPYSVRISEDEESMNELVETVKEHGILEPILVRSSPSGLLQVVAGGRRLRAAEKAGLSMVPVIIRELSDQEAMEISLIENLQRKDLTDYEKGRWLQEMMQKFPESYPTQEALAKRIGITQGRVSQLLAMFEAVEKDPIIKRLIMEKPDASSVEVQAIMSIPPEKREETIQQIVQRIEEGEIPSVREVKKIVKPEKPEEIEEAERGIAEAGLPEDRLLEKAERYYPLPLLDGVWRLVTIEARRLPFLRVVVEVLWEKAVQQGLADQILEEAKRRFEKPEERFV